MTRAKRVGKCLCGAVEISISAAADKIGACHCTMCRRFSGGSAFMAVHGTEQIDAKGAEHIGRYKSSDWAERGFCTQCGTPLFYHLTVGTMEYFYSAGLFQNDDKDFKVNLEIFVDQKPDFYDFANAQSQRKTSEKVFQEGNE